MCRITQCGLTLCTLAPFLEYLYTILHDILHTAILYIFVIMTQAHFFDVFSIFLSCFSNPDLRRSELSLDAVFQRTSSNSSSSSSPSSQGGSTERRGMRHVRVQMHGHAAKQSETRPSLVAEGMSTRAHSGSFPGCQRDIVYVSSALVHLSDVPRYTSDPWRCRRGHRDDRGRCSGTCPTVGQREIY